MLKFLKDKRNDDRRKGNDNYSRNNRGRSRSRDRLRRDAKEKLKEEAKLFFYYSSNKYGMSSNMPKLGLIGDQSRVKFADLVINCNTKD